ncbi:hypothetical protein C0J52_22382 [Blattella germanica]|nr:hypothetical protein C0J52_22382 [Blattella germanica]
MLLRSTRLRNYACGLNQPFSIFRILQVCLKGFATCSREQFNVVLRRMDNILNTFKDNICSQPPNRKCVLYRQ